MPEHLFLRSFIVPPRVENGCKPCCRSHDHFCGNVCRPVSYLAHGPCMDALFCIALSQIPAGLFGQILIRHLMWDVFAISTYFTVSLLFWYSGLLPDFATVRDRAKTKLRKFFYGVASFGWTGSTKHWQRHESLSLC